MALTQADALLSGRMTYQLMEDAWRPPISNSMPDWTQSFARTIDAAKKYVVSNTLDSVDWNAEILCGELGPAVQQLKETSGMALFVGSVTLPTAPKTITCFEVINMVMAVISAPYWHALT